MHINVGGKSKDDEEIQMDVKRVEFDERKRTHYVATLTTVILYFSRVFRKYFFSHLIIYILFCILQAPRFC